MGARTASKIYHPRRTKISASSDAADRLKRVENFSPMLFRKGRSAL
jgi:hypothetical protein